MSWDVLRSYSCKQNNSLRTETAEKKTRRMDAALQFASDNS